MSWTCDSCKQTFAGPCYHACGIPERKPVKSPLSRVRNPQGRVDVLLAHLLDAGVSRINSPMAPAIYSQVKPLVDQVLKQSVGPRTRRGKRIAEELRKANELVQQIQEQRRKGNAA